MTCRALDPAAPDDKGERLLDWITEQVDHRLNPEGDDCPECHGEGGTYDCIDGMCADAEDGCPDCFTPCVGCRIYERTRLRDIRKAVVELGDVDIGIAWLKSVDRWREDITREQVAEALARERQALDPASAREGGEG